MRFVVDIHLRNDAVQTGRDVADLLRDVANFVEDDGVLDVYDVRHIRDTNGNRCGIWSIERELSDES